MSKTERFPPLSVDADLTLTLEGHEYTVRDRDDVLVVEAPTLPAALTLLGALPEADGLGRLVSTTGLSAEIRVRDAVVATAGQDVDGGVLSRSVGVPTALDTGGVARALGREARARPATILALGALVAVVLWGLARAVGETDGPD